MAITEHGTRARLTGLLVILAALCTGVSASAPPATGPSPDVRDGSFESAAAKANFVHFARGAQLGPWMVGGAGGVDLVGNYWHAADGKQSLHLSRDGAVAQELATEPGRSYQLRFALAGNPDGQQPLKHLELWWNGKLIDTIAFDTTGHTRDEMGWRYFTYTLPATDTVTRLRFNANDQEQWGPAIDQVSVTRAPASGK